MVNNHIVGESRIETIVNLLQWISDNFIHCYEGYTYINMEDHWQYRGIPPITCIIGGTTRTGTGQFEHWTAGCHGTAGFIRNVLRAANIPVQIPRVCDHSQVYFITEGLYLDHADNPYNNAFLEKGAPVIELLIDEETYISWFGPELDNHDNNCEYIEQQVRIITG